MRYLYVVVGLHSGRGEVHADALDVWANAALEEPLDGAFHRRPLHLVLQVVAQDAIKLLHVLCSTIII